MKVRVALIAILVSMASAAAYADGYSPPPAPIVLKVSNWTGFYVGAQGGYGWSDPAFAFPVVQYFADVPGQSLSADSQGAVYGAHATLNYQLGPLVVGGEVAFNGTTINDDRTGGVSPNFPNDQYKVDIDNYLTVTGRLGYAIDKWMVYADGGYANAKVTLNAVSGVPGPGVIANTEDRLDGWTVGGGLEYMIDPHIVLGVQYYYLKFDGERFQTTSTGSIIGVPPLS